MTSDLLQGLMDARFASGGRDPETGLDCWGLFLEIQRRLGRPNIPDPMVEARNVGAIDDAASAQLAGGHWALVHPPELGDAVLMRLDAKLPRLASHVGTALDPRRFVHILEGRGVHLVNLDHPFYVRRVVGVYRWTP